MRVSIDTFVGMSSWMLRLLSGPICSDQVCLVTMEHVQDLWFAARASDGRIYDAIALQCWLSSSKHTHVIPGSNIDHVTMTCPLLLLCQSALRKCRSGLQKLGRAMASRHAAPRRTNMFLRVVSYHKQAFRDKGAHLMQRHPRSAFEPPNRRFGIRAKARWLGL